MSSEDNGRVTLAVLKKELEHVVSSLAELKEEVKDLTREEKLVRKEEFLELKKDVSKLKSFHIYMVALASIISPVILLVLRYFIGGLFGS